MQLLRLVDVGTLVCHLEVLLQCGKKLFRAQSVEILDDAVVVEDGQLAGLEADGHEVVILFVAAVVGVLLLFLCTHEGSGCRAVVSVGNIE